jgi:exonuclease VII small subunit
VLLKRHCERKLAEARERVDQITRAPDGAPGLSPLPDME